VKWIWSSIVQVEFFGCIGRIWGALDDAGRAEFLEIIFEGPPRAMFRPDLPDDELNVHSQQLVWERLARLNRAGPALVGEAAARLRELESQHPDWKLTGAAREGFPYWTTETSGFRSPYSSEELLRLTDDELVRILKEYEGEREGLLEAWRSAASTEQARAIRILGRLLEEEYLDTHVWSATLSAFRELRKDEELRTSVIALLSRLPSGLTENTAISHVVADAVLGLSGNVSDGVRESVLAIWDAALPPSLKVPTMDDKNRVTAAINHPTGVLVEALFDVLGSRELERGQGIAADVRSRLDTVLDARGGAGQVGRVIIASRLALLFDLDPIWTRSRLIPFFSWDVPEEAKGAWQGYLWSPWLRPSLWAVLKPPFLETFRHLDELGERGHRIATVLASVAIEGEDGAITDAETRTALKLAGGRGREDAAMWIEKRLEGAGDQAPALWREKIGPWLQRAWPKELGLPAEGSSSRLVEAAVAAKGAFAEAADTILPIIGPIQHGYMIIDMLRGAGLIERRPLQSLRLVNALAGDTPQPWFGQLGSFVDELLQAEPGLVDNPHLRRLRELSIRHGL